MIGCIFTKVTSDHVVQVAPPGSHMLHVCTSCGKVLSLVELIMDTSLCTRASVNHEIT